MTATPQLLGPASEKSRALVVRQPWAWAIATGAKTTENRGRRTGWRGPLAIVAGQDDSLRGWRSSRVQRLLADEHRAGRLDDTLTVSGIRGAIVAVAELDDCHLSAGCCTPWGEDRYVNAGGRVTPMAWHYTLTRIVQLAEPIPCRGMRGLFRLPGDTATEVLRIHTTSRGDLP